MRALDLPGCNYVYSPTATCPGSAGACSTETPATQDVMTFHGSGKAQNVGAGRDSGNVRIKGEFTLPAGLKLDQATMTLTHLLDEKAGSPDLIGRAGGAAFLPLRLSGRSGNKPTAATYETPSGARPSVKVEVKKRDAQRATAEFSITVDRASIADPVGCAGDSITDLNTTFALQTCDHLVFVDATLPWQCRGKELRTP